MANPRRPIDKQVEANPTRPVFSRGLRLRRVNESPDDNGQWCCTGSFDATVYLNGDLPASEALRLGRWYIATENYLFRLLQPFGVMPVPGLIETTERLFGAWEGHPRSRAQLIANYLLIDELKQLFGASPWIMALQAKTIGHLNKLHNGAIRAARGLHNVKRANKEIQTWINLAMASDLYGSIGEAGKDSVVRRPGSSAFPLKPYPGLQTIGAPLPIRLSPSEGRQPGWFIGVWEQTTFVWIYTEDVSQVAWKYQVFQVLQHPVIPLDQLRRSA